MPSFTPLRIITRGFGGPAGAIVASGILTFPIIVEELRRNLGQSSKDLDEFTFVDDVDIYKISAMLVEINNKPLDNVIYNKITKLVFDKKIKVNVDLLAHTSTNQDEFKIVIGEYSVKRGSDE